MATSPVITGAPTRASSNVTRLPTAAARKVPCRHFTGAQLADRGVPRILPVPDPVQSYFLDPRHAYPAALIVAEAILAQLTPDQRREAQNTVHQVYQRIGGDEARAASAFMAGVR